MSTDTSLTLTLDDRDEALLLFGSRDQNLRLIRETLGVRLVARGDFVHVEGTPEQVDQAQRIFQQLRLLLQEAGQADPGQRAQRAGRGAAAGGARRAAKPDRSSKATAMFGRAPMARPAMSTPCATTIWSSASARPAPARPISPSAWPSTCCGRTRSARSSWSARPSRRARSSASCPATSWPRSIRICGRCWTPWAR